MNDNARTILLWIALLTWPSVAGASALFIINGLGSSGAFSDFPSSSAQRSLLLSIRHGAEIGLKAMPFLSLVPAASVFCARRYMPLLPDVAAGALGGAIVCGIFIVWITIEPLDPLLGGLQFVVLAIALLSGLITGGIVAVLRPRSNRTSANA